MSVSEERMAEKAGRHFVEMPSKKQLMLKSKKAPVSRWFILTTLISAAFIFILNIIYFLKEFISKPLILAMMGLAILVGVGYFITAIIYIILTIKRKLDTNGLILAGLGISPLLVPLIFSLLKIDASWVVFIENTLPLLVAIVASTFLYTSSGASKKRYSHHLSITKLVLLNIATVGIYRIGWLIKNWSDIDEDTRKEVSIWNTLGLIIPIVNIFMIYAQFKEIKELAEENAITLEWSAGWSTFWVLFLTSISSRLFEMNPEGLIVSIGAIVLATLPMISVQDTLNDIWGKTQNLPQRIGLSIGETIWLVVGLIVWVGVIGVVLHG
jgi:hypothetical protein